MYMPYTTSKYFTFDKSSLEQYRVVARAVPSLLLILLLHSGSSLPRLVIMESVQQCQHTPMKL